MTKGKEKKTQSVAPTAPVAPAISLFFKSQENKSIYQPKFKVDLAKILPVCPKYTR